jgi:predicted transcriptional regulator
LNRKAALTILLAMLIFSVAFTAAASSSDRPFFFEAQHASNLEQITASVPIVLGASLHGNCAQPLDQATRMQIHTYIKNNPGVHFRGICDALGLSVGVVQYHLSVLERAGLITACADGQNKRYFENNVYTKTDMQLISLMRHGTTAKILTLLAQEGSALHRDIASCLGISSQALTWQMNQLKKTGLVNAEKTGVNVSYSLNDANACKLIINLNQQLKN